VALSPGEVFAGRYRIDGVLGAGGMGAVYAATHVATKRVVALKVILSGITAPEAVVRFEREAEVAGQLDTRHAVQVLDAGVADGTPFLVMELLRGSDLAKLVADHGPLAPRLALAIASQAAAGLARAHERGVVHRDIKSANLFLARADDDEVVVKLLDFGIAKLRAPRQGAAEHALTRTGAMIGSPLYMSPEQALGEREIDHRADLFSLGVALYEMLAGAAPFHHLASIARLMVAILNEDAPPLATRAPWVDARVAAIVARLLSRDREARFQSAAELRATLLPLCGGSDRLHASDLAPENVPAGARSLVISTDGGVGAGHDATLGPPAATPGVDVGSAPTVADSSPSGASAADSGAVDASGARPAGSRPLRAALGVGVVVAIAAVGAVALRSSPPTAASGAPAGLVVAAEPRAVATTDPATVSAAPSAAGVASTAASSAAPPLAAASASASPPTSASARGPSAARAAVSARPSSPPGPSPAPPPPPPAPGLAGTPNFE
jgi:serine/threonine-protein kinase